MRYSSLSILLALVAMTGIALASPAGSASASNHIGSGTSTAPFVQLAELTSSDGICDLYGLSVAADGDTVVVGAPFYDPIGNAAGAVYVYVKGPNGWSDMTQVARLTQSDGGTDFLGQSVAISGDTVAVGAFGYTVGSNVWQGAIYVYTKPAGGWTDMTETARLTASDGANNDQMGRSVGISGNTIVTAAKGEAYVFVEPSGGWVSGTETAKLTTSRGDLVTTAAINGGTIVAANDITSINGKAEGAAFVYVKPAGGWIDATQDAVLTPSDGMKNGFFGQSVAVSGSTIAVGASGARDGDISQAGAAYVFVKPVSGWRNMTQTAKLTASPAERNNRLGWSVATNGNTVIAGAIQQVFTGGRGPGAAYVFSKPPFGGWIDEHESSILRSSDGALGDGLGFGVALSGTDPVASAPFRAGDIGAAYVFGN